MNLFYIENIDTNNCILPEEESKHCIKVLRFTKGSKLAIVDGKGNWYNAEIDEAHAKHCRFNIIEVIPEFNKRNFRIHLAVAPTKNIERLEWMLEKCTEMGIDEISLIKTEHSERKIVKIERLQKIIISAMKQSLKAYLPQLNHIISFNEFIDKIAESNRYSHRFIAHCHESEKQNLNKAYKKGEDILILIGPEGDFSIKEVELAKKNNFKELTLSTSRLRTETAGVVACHSINFLNEV